MVISVTPRARSKFNDLATLKIEHSRGILETPNRFVNRHDLNAKDQIGADIPLTRKSKSFIIQEIVNPEKLESILNKNGYLSQMLTKTNQLARRVDNSDSLILLYPSLTQEARELLISSHRMFDFLRFFAELAGHMSLESVLLPTFDGIDTIINITRKRNLQVIPVLDLRSDTQSFTKQFLESRAAGSVDVPVMAFRFATYKSANKAYDLVMDNLDKLHEDGQATMLVDAPRFLSSAESKNVSGPHYGSFMIADVIAERYRGAARISNSDEEKKGQSNGLRLFCRQDLITPVIHQSIAAGDRFSLDEEEKVFAHDKGLQELFARIVQNKILERDWYYNRPRYLSRVHENIRTREEFEIFQKHISANTATDYLSEKKEMNSVVNNHLVSRKKS